jgi:ComF family protein
MWAYYLNQAGQWIFPPLCVHCERVGDWICPACWRDSVRPHRHQYPQIEGIRGIHSLAAHIGAIRESLHALKYKNTPALAWPLGQALAQGLPWPVEAVIPIPLHASRLQERGYNQAALLGRSIAHTLGRPLLTTHLVRHKATQTQVGLGTQERRQNVETAFLARGSVPEGVLLVDDVCTTGATLGAAAAALQALGVQAIYAATVSLAGQGADA